jgi:hypothetical protein
VRSKPAGRLHTQVAVGGKVRQKGGDVLTIEFARVTPAMEHHESANPADIRFPGARVELARTTSPRDLVEQFRPP